LDLEGPGSLPRLLDHDLRKAPDIRGVPTLLHTLLLGLGPDAPFFAGQQMVKRHLDRRSLRPVPICAVLGDDPRGPSRCLAALHLAPDSYLGPFASRWLRSGLESVGNLP